MDQSIKNVECCKKCCHCSCNQSDKYNWNHVLFVIDMMVQQGKLTESQMRKVIDIIDLKKLVKYNKLRPEFIENVLRPMIDNDFDDDLNDDPDRLTMIDVYKIQQYNFRKK